ncbi:MAG: hypothetical protein C5B59_01015 [Bacteroidetes bacterium]|nr:MAG: hypothetical protein C5B59_01015 [Bacteroidota bacterium]
MQFELPVYLIGNKRKNMKINRKMIVGAILSMVGAFIIDYPIIRHIDQRTSWLIQLLGLTIFVCAVIFIYQGKRQQKQNREENNL